MDETHDRVIAGPAKKDRAISKERTRNDGETYERQVIQSLWYGLKLMRVVVHKVTIVPSWTRWRVCDYASKEIVS